MNDMGVILIGHTHDCQESEIKLMISITFRDHARTKIIQRMEQVLNHVSSLEKKKTQKKKPSKIAH